MPSAGRCCALFAAVPVAHQVRVASSASTAEGLVVAAKGTYRLGSGAHTLTSVYDA